MEPRLPALTAEERIIEQLTKAENDARTARSNAFEEAAALRPEHHETADGTYSDGWREGCNEYAAMLTNRALALAKEKTK